jgi:hypothetical protein
MEEDQNRNSFLEAKRR